MPIGDILNNAEVAQKPAHKPHCPPPEPMWFVPAPGPLPIPADYPYYDPYRPPFPPPPPPPHPDDDDDDDDDKDKDELKASIEMQICKLSKRAAAIKAMIDNFKNKNKDAIIRIGSISYNFGPYYDIKKEGELIIKTETEYGEAIMSILISELSLIKVKITELAEQLENEEDANALINGVLTTVTQD